MRIATVIIGILIVAIGVAYFLGSLSDNTLLSPAILVLALGALNIVLGLATARATGVHTPSERQSPVKMVVDRGVIGSTVYVMAFSDAKLVLKRLTSGGVTVLAVIALALVGFFFAFIIGAAVGGITSFSVQEFLTQRKRATAMEGNLLDPSGKGDMEFVYEDLDRVQLTPTRLRLFLKNGILGIVISRKYPPKMRPILERIIPPSKMREKS